MASEHLSKRKDWQTSVGAGPENTLKIALDSHFDRYYPMLEYHHKPKVLKGIYGERAKGRPHGIEPDGMIRNTDVGQSVFVEMKKQKQSGNAHERLCKIFTPGIWKSACEMANQPQSVLPWWVVLSDKITHCPYRRQEIAHWFHGFDGHVFFWQEWNDAQPLIKHFEIYIKRLLGNVHRKTSQKNENQGVLF